MFYSHVAIVILIKKTILVEASFKSHHIGFILVFRVHKDIFYTEMPLVFSILRSKTKISYEKLFKFIKKKNQEELNII